MASGRCSTSVVWCQARSWASPSVARGVRRVSQGRPVPTVEGLDPYFALLDQAYAATPHDVMRLAGTPDRVFAGSPYLGGVVPESAELHNVLGIAFASKGQMDQAIAEFNDALPLDPGTGGDPLASRRGAREPGRRRGGNRAAPPLSRARTRPSTMRGATFAAVLASARR